MKMHPFAHLCRELDGGEKYYSLPDLQDDRVKHLPYSIRVLLESVIRNCDEYAVTKEDVEKALNWAETCKTGQEIAFKPARVLLQDFTGVPCCVDLAAMRNAVGRLGGDPLRINPLLPTEMVVDHSVVVDESRSPDALSANEALEMERNRERFAFLKWASRSFRNLLIVPPGSGIVHQVNLEYLARGVFAVDGLCFPDSVVGTDSHTPMVNGLGVVGWGVGGIEAEAVMLGQPISLVLPEVIGFELVGKLNDRCTATDLVLTVTRMLRDRGVVGKFVEFFGEGCASLSVADRATLSNMSPENGATISYFPVDAKTIEYFHASNRPKASIQRLEKYLKAQGLFRTYDASDAEIVYSGPPLKLDLGTVIPCVAGPKRPHDRVALADMPRDFASCLSSPVSFKGFGIPADKRDAAARVKCRGTDVELRHGSVVIAAITSCTNTSNPSVMLGAGLLAQKARQAGLSVSPHIKTSLSPGSHVVELYLKAAGLLESFEQMGFYLCGFGCQTCIGNSGELDEDITKAVYEQDLVVAAVLSGNRNYEGRIHPLTRANYLASPMLVMAYALAGTVAHDFEKTPLGKRTDGTPVFLRDIWPSRKEIEQVELSCVTPQLYKQVYDGIENGGSADWRNLEVRESKLYEWSDESTYIHNPPFFATMKKEPEPIRELQNARVLLYLGDSVTTDHISPAGSIAKDSPAGKWLLEHGIGQRDFNSYGSRRGNDEIMARGTFANIRLINKLHDKSGPYTRCHLSGKTLPVYEAAMEYSAAGTPLVILAGKDYGSGSSRDWAAKGPMMQGVRAVIAQSFERIHRSNLVGMGILPLCFGANESAESLGLDGTEEISIDMSKVSPGCTVTVQAKKCDGSIVAFDTKCRIDTRIELSYFQHGGILHYVLRKLIE